MMICCTYCNGERYTSWGYCGVCGGTGIQEEEETITEMKEQEYNVKFSQSSYDYLCEAAIDQGIPIAEVIANALALDRWMREETRKGAKIFLSRNGTGQDAQELRFTK